MQTHHIFMNVISVKCMSIRLMVNFSLKYQLLYNDYHSNGFYPSDYVNNKPNKHFAVFLPTFPIILPFLLIFENQNVVENVIQLIKKEKPYRRVTVIILSTSTIIPNIK